jgi:hypothetical protein
MGSNGWKHLRHLQNATRDGFNKLSTKRNDPSNSLVHELVMDLFLIGIGLPVYIQLDIVPFLPFVLPDVIQSGSFRPIVATIGLAIAGFGGIRMLFALLEATTWMVGKLFQKK